MAERRMFSKRVINSARFLKMPLTTQALYFHLGLQADDDGIVEAWNILRAVGCTEDDLRVLAAKDFVEILNEDLVTYILDWNENNKIRPDRKIDSIYKDLLIRIKPDVQLIEKRERADKKPKIVEAGQPMDNQRTDNGQPMDGIGEDRLGKDRLGEDRLGKDKETDHAPYKQIVEDFNNTCISYPKVTALSEARKKAIKARLKTVSIEDIHKAFEMAEQSDFLKGANSRNWSANFDWIMKDANLAKILDGNYTNKGKTQQDGFEWLSQQIREGAFHDEG